MCQIRVAANDIAIALVMSYANYAIINVSRCIYNLYKCINNIPQIHITSKYIINNILFLDPTQMMIKTLRK